MTTASLPRIEATRAKYRPDHVRWLFIGEAPPDSVDRFFYYEHVPAQDSLFLSLMRVLYPSDCGAADPKVLRSKKPALLARFRSDGCYLEDATPAPLPDQNPNQKQKVLRANLPGLLGRLEPLRHDSPKVFLISSNVYTICAGPLREDAWDVRNNQAVPFPGSSGQTKFCAVMSRLLTDNGWRG